MPANRLTLPARSPQGGAVQQGRLLAVALPFVCDLVALPLARCRGWRSPFMSTCDVSSQR